MNIWETSGAKKGLFHSGNPRKTAEMGQDVDFPGAGIVLQWMWSTNSSSNTPCNQVTFSPAHHALNQILSLRWDYGSVGRCRTELDYGGVCLNLKSM
jgi:hypothetical protein